MALPVRRRKTAIIEKIVTNRVTIIIAETGSGKSTQVPQMLLEEGYSPILCTQPRRLAVVAVSKMVAEERGCELGEEVGFHIGQMNKTSPSSKIVFQTAGVLLEEIKARGTGALNKYKVVILDEIHERSIESDMILCCVKLLMLRNKTIKLVLMSATADFKRYEDYFSDLGENVARICIEGIAKMVQCHLFSCSVKYLDQVVNMLGNKGEHLSLLNSTMQNPCPYKRGTDIGSDIQNIIFDLIVDIHEKEKDLQKAILVFLPTYRALEEQWTILKLSQLNLEVYVLHSSVDIDQSIEAMEAYHSKRKVILATDVAESSITIRGAAFVIDSCRCLEIIWKNDVKKDAPRIVWISHSQAEQRKGRTGRTCDGVVYRMVPRQVYVTLPKFETPAMQLLSLRKQVLLLSCAETRALNDATGFFRKCLNPPHADTVQNAYDALLALDALNCVKGKYVPTGYGRLLAALPLSLEAAMLVIEGTEQEYLNECAIIAAVLDATPNPIVQPFGASADYSNMYFQEAGNNGRVSPPGVLIGNLCAFEFWQLIFKDKLRYKKLLSYLLPELVCTEDPKVIDDQEKEWCAMHRLSRFSLHGVAETVSAILEVMHHYRPQSLTLHEGIPSYFTNTAHFFNHQCVQIQRTDENTACDAVPYVANGIFHTEDVENRLARIIVEVQSRYLQISATNDLTTQELFVGMDFDGDTVQQCVYFRTGSCAKGSSCPYSHSMTSRPAVCKFYLSGECRYGAQCRYAHIGGVPINPKSHIEFGKDIYSFGRVCSRFSREGTVLIFGKQALNYIKELNRFLNSCPVILACSEEGPQPLDIELGPAVEIVWSINPSSLTANNLMGSLEILNWRKIACVISNFPLKNILPDQHKEYIREFFQFLAVMQIHFLRENRGANTTGLYLVLTMSTHEFSQCRVLRSARESFFFLESSFVVDPAFFGEEDEPPLKLVSYVFKMVNIPVLRYMLSP